MGLQAKPVSEKLGAEIIGLKTTESLSFDEVEFLRAQFWDTGALLFRNLDFSPQQLIDLSRVFGKAQLYPIPSVRMEALPELGILATNRGDLTPEYLQEGRALKYIIPWHADCMFYETPSAANMLYAIEVPEQGGQTGLIDTCKTYEALSPSLRKKIDGLEIVCRFRTSPHFMKFGRDESIKPPADQTLDAHQDFFPEFTDKAHPLVLTHPITARKALNVNPFVAEGLLGIDKSEGDDLLEELIAHSTSKRFSYFHDWQPGDLLVFDNYRMLHSVKGVPIEYERLLHSVVLGGETKTGRELAASV